MNYDDKGQPNSKLCSLDAGSSWVILPLICTRLLPTPATQSITGTLPWRWRMMSVMAYVHVSICLCCHNVLFLCCHNVYMWPQWRYSAFAVHLILARNDYWPDLSDTPGTTPSWPGLKPGLEPNLGCRTRPKAAAPTPEQQRSRMPSRLAFHSLRALCTLSYLVFKIKEDASFCVTLYQAQCKK